MVPRDRTTAGKLGEGPALGSPGVAAPQQRKRRRADGDTDSDTDTGGASKRTLASGEGGRDAVRGRGDDARKDEDLGDGERVTNENIMNMLRSIKDSLSLLTPAGVPRTTAGVGRMVTIQQMPSPLEGGAAASPALAANEQALETLLRKAQEGNAQHLGPAPACPHPDMDPRISRIGQLSDETQWADNLDPENIEEVFKDMWAAMHPHIALAEGEDEPAGASAEGKKTSKRPLTLQAKKKYIRRNIKVALEGVRSKLQVLACCPWMAFMFAHCDVSVQSAPFLKAGELYWSRNLSEAPTSRYIPTLGLDQMKMDGADTWLRRPAAAPAPSVPPQPPAPPVTPDPMAAAAAAAIQAVASAASAVNGAPPALPQTQPPIESPAAPAPDTATSTSL